MLNRVDLGLLDYRRTVAAVYAEVRATPDPAEAHSLWVSRRTTLMGTHPQSADRNATLHHAPYDEAWRAELEINTHVEPRHIEIPSATDGVVPFDLIGVVDHPKVGDLAVWWLGSYGGGVWLPLRDPSPLTYGGGRYVLDSVKGADLGGDFDPATGRGSLVVDLNFAYNPSCAYDEAWACPLAPPGSVVDVEIGVGELLPG